MVNDKDLTVQAYNESIKKLISHLRGKNMNNTQENRVNGNRYVRYPSLVIPNGTTKKVIILHNFATYDMPYMYDVVHTFLYNEQRPAYCRKIIGQNCPVCQIRYENESLFWDTMKQAQAFKMIHTINATTKITLYVFDLTDNQIKTLNIYGNERDNDVSIHNFEHYFNQFIGATRLADSINAVQTEISRQNYVYTFTNTGLRTALLSDDIKQYLKNVLVTLVHWSDRTPYVLSYIEMANLFCRYLQTSLGVYAQSLCNVLYNSEVYQHELYKMQQQSIEHRQQPINSSLGTSMPSTVNQIDEEKEFETDAIPPEENIDEAFEQAAKVFDVIEDEEDF